MSAYNVVRFRVKPGRETEFEDKYREIVRSDSYKYKGLRKAVVVKTGDRAYCSIGEWNSFDDIVAARPQMIGNLDQLRDFFEDLGGGLGISDPVSGQAVIEFNAA